MERHRAVSLYPGKTKCGVAFWVIDDSTLRAVAVGSLPIETINGVVGKFSPHVVFIESERPETDPNQAGIITLPGDTRLRYAHPSWRETYLPIPQKWGRKVGRYSLHATRLGFNELFRRGRKLRLREFKPVQYSGSWLERYRRRGVKQ